MREKFHIVSGLLGAIVVAVPLIFLLVPTWKPDPREKVSASVRIIAVEPGKLLGNWLRRRYPDEETYAVERKRLLGSRFSKAELRQRGEIVYVRMRVDGSKGRSVTLLTRLYDADTGRSVDFGVDEIVSKTSNVKIDAPSRSSVQMLFFADLEPEPGPHFIRVELRNKDGLLAMDDSPKLRCGRFAGSTTPRACPQS